MQTDVACWPLWVGERKKAVGEASRVSAEMCLFRQLVCGSLLYLNHANGWSGEQFLYMLLSAAVRRGVFQPSQTPCPGRQLCWRTWWSGELCFLGGSGSKLPDSFQLLWRVGVISVVRQNTWILGLFRWSVVWSCRFLRTQVSLFPGLCSGGSGMPPVKGFCFHSARQLIFADTAASWCCCFQSDWPPSPRDERVSSWAADAPFFPLILSLPCSVPY